MCHVNWQMESFRVSACLYGKIRISVEPSCPSDSFWQSVKVQVLEDWIPPFTKLHIIQFNSLVKGCPWCSWSDPSALRETHLFCIVQIHPFRL
jgi:hypothetical protein